MSEHPPTRRETDFSNPATTVRIFDRLVDVYHLEDTRFRRLHHAKKYENTVKKHRIYAAEHAGRFQSGGTNEATARRFYECLLALDAGQNWEAAIATALAKVPRPG